MPREDDLMADLPYMPFYPADYFADAHHLTTVEHGAYFLLITTYWMKAAPLPDDDRKLAKLTKLTPSQWGEIREELADFFVVEDGVWRHKRIDADLKHVSEKVEKARNAGKASAKRRSNGRSTDVEQTLNGRATNQSQSQTSLKRDEGQGALGNALTPDEVVEEWNVLATDCGLPQVRKLTDARKRKLKVRLNEYPEIEDWQRAFAHIRKTPFLRGENRSGWRADFDFLLQASSFTKLTEEAYGKD